MRRKPFCDERTTDGRPFRSGGKCVSIRAKFRRRWILAAICFMAFVPAATPQKTPAKEYQVKAAFLYNFAKFVDWNDSKLAAPPYPFTVCVLGADPFGRVLNDALLGKTVEEHPVMLVRYPHPSAISGCQVIFISASETSNLPEIFADLRGRNVLTVGDSEGFAAAGGVIQFTLQDHQVHFKINLDAAGREGLKISSKLLALATIVHDPPRVAESQ
ncbi:MAG: YfiR family protein [Candidatus Acidiferrales bacterium]